MKAMLKKYAAKGLAILSIISFGFGLEVTAKGENRPSAEIDQVMLNQYSQRVENTGTDVVYKITITAQAPDIEAMHPPQLISFVLDGTASMADQDGTAESRDIKVRRAVISALNVLMSDANPNKENTFVDVVLFGGNQGEATNLVAWAKNSGVRSQIENGTMTYVGYYNKENYVPLLEPGTTDKLNHLLANLFYCTNAQPINALPSAGFGTIVAPDYAISNEYFYGNELAPVGHQIGRFPANSYETFIGPGLRMAYEDLSLKEADIRASGTYTQDEKDNMSKYVMLLTDGEENQQGRTIPSTISWATALKAPTDPGVTYPTLWHPSVWATGTGVPAIAYPGTTRTVYKKGLEAKIWVMVIGNAVNLAWGHADNTNQALTDYVNNQFVGGAPHAGWQAARSMIGVAQAGIDSAGWASLAAVSNNFTGGGANEWGNYYNLLRPLTAAPNMQTFMTETKYLQTVAGSSVTSFFSDFAANAIQAEGVRNVQADGNIAMEFSLYKGTDPQYKPYTFSSISNKAPEPRIVITRDGKIKWEIGAILPGEKVTLVYYVQLKPEYVNSGYDYHPVTGMVIRFDGAEGSGYWMNFPANYVSATASSVVVTGNKGLNLVSDEQTTDVQGQLLLLPADFLWSGATLSLDVAKAPKANRVKITKKKATIYQKTTAGKYKAVAVAKENQSFAYVLEMEDYYKIYFRKKGKEQVSAGYIKKSDGIMI